VFDHRKLSGFASNRSAECYFKKCRDLPGSQLPMSCQQIIWARAGNGYIKKGEVISGCWNDSDGAVNRPPTQRPKKTQSIGTLTTNIVACASLGEFPFGRDMAARLIQTIPFSTGICLLFQRR